MTFHLRPYQGTCVDRAMDFIRKTTAPCVIDAAPAAGKSFIIARLAAILHEISDGKRILCIAPSRELVLQNREKFLLTGEPASMFSASAGEKSMKHPVIFGTPATVKNALSRFSHGFAAIIIDECHGITPTIKTIIERMRETNPNIRVIGLSGTPYRLGTGYIFRMNPDDSIVPEHQTKNPYFMKCVHKVSAQEMLDQGFITPMVVGDECQEQYDTSKLVLNKMGKFDAEGIDRAFVGHGRKTSKIVEDVVKRARGRFGGVMLFGATVQHANEILASLPPSISRIVTGETSRGERATIIKQYREGLIRYLVSVGTLTTGFDVEHTEVIALLRKTESAALLQQIMGRSWRLHPDKETSLLLDYASNVEDHFPDGDIYNPEISVTVSDKERIPLTATCPECANVNEFSARKNDEGFEHDEEGYFVDLDGNRIAGDYGEIPAHFGRRCQGLQRAAGGKYEQCAHRWNGKECPHCMADNDIAARYCCECKSEIVNPNDKLRIEFKQLKRDPTRRQTDAVMSLNVSEGMSRAGNETIRADWITEYRSFSTWFQKEPKNERGLRDRNAFLAATKEGQPESITYEKDAGSGFYRIGGYNHQPDEAPV